MGRARTRRGSEDTARRTITPAAEPKDYIEGAPWWAVLGPGRCSGRRVRVPKPSPFPAVVCEGIIFTPVLTGTTSDRVASPDTPAPDTSTDTGYVVVGSPYGEGGGKHPDPFRPGKRHLHARSLADAESSTDQNDSFDKTREFRDLLMGLSVSITSWEAEELLHKALGLLPVAELIKNAHQMEVGHLEDVAQLELETGLRVVEWDRSDFLIRALLAWFGKSFFSWVNHPPCPICASPTVFHGMTAPIEDERQSGALRVELYRCKRRIAELMSAFPGTLMCRSFLETRCGRVGEWVNCFGLFCRALQSDVRWVWSTEDHVWIEVYSRQQRRWIHVDVCDQLWDKPLTYTEGR